MLRISPTSLYLYLFRKVDNYRLKYDKMAEPFLTLPLKMKIYCSTNSTRRFLARPPSVLLAATGASCPTPYALRRWGFILYFVVSILTTASARAKESFML